MKTRIARKSIIMMCNLITLMDEKGLAEFQHEIKLKCFFLYKKLMSSKYFLFTDFQIF